MKHEPIKVFIDTDSLTDLEGDIVKADAQPLHAAKQVAKDVVPSGYLAVFSEGAPLSSECPIWERCGGLQATLVLDDTGTLGVGLLTHDEDGNAQQGFRLTNKQAITMAHYLLSVQYQWEPSDSVRKLIGDDIVMLAQEVTGWRQSNQIASDRNEMIDKVKFENRASEAEAKRQGFQEGADKYASMIHELARAAAMRDRDYSESVLERWASEIENAADQKTAVN
ncbi:MAG: hypothetical protein V7723_19640 [Sneathiella sp.]|uniref:hypothetical protein n=1 Tax=Sneathiella sp. TaxID=1964365 RepID=UPI0030011178